MTPALVTAAPSACDAAAELALDPVAGLARVAADEEAERTLARPPAPPSTSAARAPAPRRAADGLVIERIVARLAADAVGAEQSRHILMTDVTVVTTTAAGLDRARDARTLSAGST